MKVLFLQENAYNESIGVACLSSCLKKNGHVVDLIAQSEEKNFFDKINTFSPDIIAFSCTTDMHNWVLETVKKCKKILPAKIILGGPHPTCFPEIIENKGVDMICQGEGEVVFVELLNRISNKDSYINIPGIWVKKGKKIYKNGATKLIQDFSSFPLPDRELYYKYKFIRDLPVKRFITGRGCPFNCAFCHNQLLMKTFKDSGPFVRKYSFDRIISEILNIKENYPLTAIHFSDDTFTLNKVWFKQFCKEYKKKINLPFTCNLRADMIDEDNVKILKNSGCRAVSFGLESGNEKIRNQILDKNIDDVVYIRVSKLLKKYKIKFLTNNIVGVPGETENDIWDTLRLNRLLKPNFTRAFIFDAFPNLPLTNYAIKLGFLKKDYSIKDFNSMSHEPIIDNVNKNLMKNFSQLFYILVKFKVPIFILKFIIKIPSNKIFYLFSRLSQAYVESQFFKAPFIPGIRYFIHISKSFKSN